MIVTVFQISSAGFAAGEVICRRKHFYFPSAARAMINLQAYIIIFK
jgi:hypothetical protein